VTDDGNPFVQKFDNNGQFLMKWGGQGSEDGQFRHATGIAVDAQGNVFVADYEDKRVQKFNPQGEFVAGWTMGSDLNSTGTPEGIAVDAAGHVFITDYALGRVQVFSNDGEPLFAWGKYGPEPGQFRNPTGIALDADGNAYVVSQANNNVQVFQLPPIE
jgi:DNA-binding beta-propeller fold protein YncE